MRKTIKKLMEEEGIPLGVSMMYPFDTGIEVMKASGIDYIMIDLEHEQLTISDLAHMIRTSDACGMGTMVRVPDENNQSVVLKALDIGASAIMFPGIKTVEQAKDAIAVCKYAPEGKRGFCPYVRGNFYGINGGERDFYQKQNEEITVCLLIEEMEGISHLEEIIKLKGVDVIALGVFDLSCELGIPGQVGNAEIIKIIRQSTDLCKKYDRKYLAAVNSPEQFGIYTNIENMGLAYTISPIIMLHKGYENLSKDIKKHYCKISSKN